MLLDTSNSSKHPCRAIVDFAGECAQRCSLLTNIDLLKFYGGEIITPA